MKRVVCIGRRDVAQSDVGYLESIGMRTVEGGDLLISGNGRGSDQMYALGGNRVNAEMVELCLPWPKFEERWIAKDPDPSHGPDWRGRGLVGGNRIRLASQATFQHVQLANWFCLADLSRLSQGTQKLMVRNAMMLIAEDGSKSDVVLANPNMRARGWGGTGHTMRMAGYLNIPVWLVNRSRWWNPDEGTIINSS